MKKINWFSFFGMILMVCLALSYTIRAEALQIGIIIILACMFVVTLIKEEEKKK